MEGVKTAGMVQGTPDWQLDKLYEKECDRAWEEQQEEPKSNQLEKFNFDELNDAHSNFAVIKCDCQSLVKYIGFAIDALPGTPEADKLAGISDTISDLWAEMKEISARLYGQMFPGQEDSI